MTRKFSLKVSGARVGSDVRPVASVRDALPAKRFGLKVHTSALFVAPSGPPKPEDFATAEDYE